MAYAAWRAGVLTATGGFAAIFIGAAVYGSGGWPNAAVLFAFFVPAVVLSRIGHSRKKQLVDTGKQGARDGSQVFANGLAAALCALFALDGNTMWQAAFCGALAAAAADTWATEIGTLARAVPRSILTGRPVPAGLSGGITLPGTIALIAGALFVGAVASVAHASPAFAAIAAGGIAGATIDSLAGASVQALRYCAQCQRNCETDPHLCGADTTLVRGAYWMSNDAVNLIATIAGAAVAAAIYRISFPGTG